MSAITTIDPIRSSINSPDEQQKKVSVVDEKIKTFILHHLKNPSNDFINFFSGLFPIINGVNLLEKFPIQNLEHNFEKIKKYLIENDIKKTITYTEVQEIFKWYRYLQTKETENEPTRKSSSIDGATLRQALINLLISCLHRKVSNGMFTVQLQDKSNIFQGRILYKIASKICFRQFSEPFEFEKLIIEFKSIGKDQEISTKLVALRLLYENCTNLLDISSTIFYLIDESKQDSEIRLNEWSEKSSLMLLEFKQSTALFREWRELFILQMKNSLVYLMIQYSLPEELQTLISSFNDLDENIVRLSRIVIEDPKKLTAINLIKYIEDIITIREKLQINLTMLKNAVESFLNQKFEIHKVEKKPKKGMSEIKQVSLWQQDTGELVCKKEINEILNEMKSLDIDEAFDRLLQTHYILLSFIYDQEEKKKMIFEEQKNKSTKIAESLIKETPIKEKRVEMDTSLKINIEEEFEVVPPVKIDDHLLILLSELKKENQSSTSNSNSLNLQFSKKLSEIHESLLLKDSKYTKSFHPLFEAFQHIKMAIETHDLLIQILKKGNTDALMALFPSLALDYHCSVEQLLTYYTDQKEHSLEGLYCSKIKFEIDKSFLKDYNIGLLHSRYPYHYLKNDSGNSLITQIHLLIDLKQKQEKNQFKKYPIEMRSFIDFVFKSQSHFQTILFNHSRMLDPSNKELQILKEISTEVTTLNKNIKKDLLAVLKKAPPQKPFRYHSSDKIKLVLEDLLAKESDRYLENTLKDALYHLMRIESTLDYLEHKIETRHGAIHYRTLLNVHWVIELIMHYQITKNGGELPESIHDLRALYKALNRDLGDDFVSSLSKFNIAKGSHYSALEGIKKNATLVDTLNYWIQQSSSVPLTITDKSDFKYIAEEGFKIVWTLLEQTQPK